MKKFLPYFVFATALCLPLAQASTVSTFQTTSGLTDKDGPLAATVVFTVSGTTLYVSMTNNEIFQDNGKGPNAAGQLLSDLSFVLSGGVDSGILSNNISAEVGVSSPVTLLSSYDPPTGTTTTTIPNGSKGKPSWQLTTDDSSKTDCGQSTAHCYFLNDLTGGSPENMIIGPAGTGYDVNASITGHSPSLAGTVVFEIDNVAGLSSNTTVSKVVLSFGTGPDFSSPLVQVQQSPPPPTTPEPAAGFLFLSGALGLGLLKRYRRRRS